MKRLAVYMKPYIVFFLVAPVFKAIEASAELLQPKIMTTTVNAGIIAGDVSVIWRNGLLMLGVALVGIAGGVGACWFAAKSSQGFGADLRRAVFQKVQSFSFSDLDRFSTGSLVTRLTNDITQLENTPLMMQRIMVRAPLLCIGAIIMTISIQPRLAVALVSMAVALLCAVLILWAGRFPCSARCSSAWTLSILRCRRTLPGCVRSNRSSEPASKSSASTASMSGSTTRVSLRAG